MAHWTFKGNLYELVLARRARQRAALLSSLSCMEAISGDSSDIISAAARRLRHAIESELNDDPPREWKSAIGLNVVAEIDKVSSDYYGSYTLSVVGVDSYPYFKCVVTGPKGSAVWYPGCGTSETETMESVGAWRHTLRRFFGLQAKGSS